MLHLTAHLFYLMGSSLRAGPTCEISYGLTTPKQITIVANSYRFLLNCNLTFSLQQIFLSKYLESFFN
jgi:hypothetical protein